jgi:uncharacterized protein (TIGR01244 family)
MTAFTPVTDAFAVSPQISPADVAAARAQGFGLIINNRPDREAPDQPAGAEIAAAAAREGLAYLHIPVIGRPGIDAGQAMHAACAAHGGKTLAYCRTGTRSIMAWAMGELAAGTASRGEIIRLASAAGFDLAGALPP